MRVYRFDPSKRPEPQQAKLPPLPRCVDCGVCLGEAASYRDKYCAKCRDGLPAARVQRYRNKHQSR